MKKEYILVLITAPDQNSAHNIAEMLVNDHLAACVNIIPGLTSIYRWKGHVQHDSELLLLVKACKQTFKALINSVKSLHPYDLPEIIALEINDGLKEYLNWIGAETESAGTLPDKVI